MRACPAPYTSRTGPLSPAAHHHLRRGLQVPRASHASVQPDLHPTAHHMDAWASRRSRRCQQHMQRSGNLGIAAQARLAPQALTEMSHCGVNMKVSFGGGTQFLGVGPSMSAYLSPLSSSSNCSAGVEDQSYEASAHRIMQPVGQDVWEAASACKPPAHAHGTVQARPLPAWLACPSTQPHLDECQRVVAAGREALAPNRLVPLPIQVLRPERQRTDQQQSAASAWQGAASSIAHAATQPARCDATRIKGQRRRRTGMVRLKPPSWAASVVCVRSAQSGG